MKDLVAPEDQSLSAASDVSSNLDFIKVHPNARDLF